MLGMRSLYHQGWLANTLHPPISGWGKFHLDEWELYNLAEDRSQLRNLAAEHPEKLNELKELWSYYAGHLQGTAARRPHRARNHPGRPPAAECAAGALHLLPGRGRGARVGLCQRSAALIHNRRGGGPQTPEAEGVLFSQGARAGGHALYLQDGRLHYTYSWLGEREQTVSSSVEVPTGSHVLSAEFQKTGDDEQTMSATGTLTLFVDTDAVGADELMTQPGMFGLSGSGASVGRGNGSSVASDLHRHVPVGRRHDRARRDRRQRRPLRRPREGGPRLPRPRLSGAAPARSVHDLPVGILPADLAVDELEQVAPADLDALARSLRARGASTRTRRGRRRSSGGRRRSGRRECRRVATGSPPGSAPCPPAADLPVRARVACP